MNKRTIHQKHNLPENHRYPVILKGYLFPGLSDHEITRRLLALAEKDYTLEDFCPFIDNEFERLLSVSTYQAITQEDKGALCGLAFEIISVVNKWTEIAALTWLMFCCCHTPADSVHDSANLETALKGLYNYSLHTENVKVLKLLMKASYGFSLYYTNAFLEAVALYTSICRILGEDLLYEQIIKRQYDLNAANLQLFRAHLEIEKSYVYEAFLPLDFFKEPALHSINIKEDINEFLNLLCDFLKTKPK